MPGGRIAARWWGCKRASRSNWGLLATLQRQRALKDFGIGKLDLSAIPPVRLKALPNAAIHICRL